MLDFQKTVFIEKHFENAHDNTNFIQHIVF